MKLQTSEAAAKPAGQPSPAATFTQAPTPAAQRAEPPRHSDPIPTPVQPQAQGQGRASFAAPQNNPAATPRHLLSDNSNQAVSGAFNALAHTILAQNARTLEDLVVEMLQPMLREWLDDNLPTLVERLVQEEIKRVSRGRR